ncbi:MAG: ABC transporter ATP-binding protein, partial [Bacillota bacterium]|nr:ABC transporter ATP-binding protein [Bacillota bacterium]
MKVFKYLKPYTLWALLSPICMILEVWVDLMQPKLMSNIIDEGVLGGKFGMIFPTGMLMLGLVALGGIGGCASSGFASYASQNFGADLKGVVFKRVMSLSFSQTDKFTTGSLVTRLTNDISTLQNIVTMGLRMFVRSPMMLIGSIIMTLSLNPKFGYVLLCSAPFQVAIVWFMLKKASPLFSVVQRKLDKVNSVVQENVTGARMVKAYVREEYEEKRFDGVNTDYMLTGLRVQIIMSIISPVMMIIMNAAVLAIVYIGGLQVQAGNMKVGEVMAAITYTSRVLMSIMMTTRIFNSITRAKASADRVNEVLDTEPAILSGKFSEETEKKGTVEFKNVSFRYNESRESVLKDISFEVNRGEVLAILGSTGVGKTTLVNLIPRFYDASEGEVLVDGKDVREYDLKTLRDKIGYILQKSELFSGMIKENIRWGKKDATDEEVVNAAKIAQADEYIQGFNDGYDTVIGEKGMSLSGGQKQRLSIARAIIGS